MPDLAVTHEPVAGEGADQGTSPFAGPSTTSSGEIVAPEAPSRSAAIFYWFILLGSAAVLALAMTMSIQGTKDVALPGMSIPLPELCNMRRFVGIDCPGCGLTRSFISMGHGDVASAWRFNPSGPLWFIALLAQLPYRAMQLWYRRRGQTCTISARWTKWIWMVLCLSLVGQWAVRGLLHTAGW